MPQLDPSTKKLIERLCNLLRRCASKAERGTAIEMMAKHLDACGLTFVDLGNMVEDVSKYCAENDHTWSTLVERLKAGGAYTLDEVMEAKDLGEKEGAERAKAEKDLPPEFYDALGEANWIAIGAYIDKHKDRLSDWDRKFVDSDAARGTLYSNIVKFGEPTDRQKPFVLGIFIKLGGVVPPEIVARYPRQRRR